MEAPQTWTPRDDAASDAPPPARRNRYAIKAKCATSASVTRLPPDLPRFTSAPPVSVEQPPISGDVQARPRWGQPETPRFPHLEHTLHAEPACVHAPMPATGSATALSRYEESEERLLGAQDSMRTYHACEADVGPARLGASSQFLSPLIAPGGVRWRSPNASKSEEITDGSAHSRCATYDSAASDAGECKGIQEGAGTGEDTGAGAWVADELAAVRAYARAMADKAIARSAIQAPDQPSGSHTCTASGAEPTLQRPSPVGIAPRAEDLHGSRKINARATHGDTAAVSSENESERPRPQPLLPTAWREDFAPPESTDVLRYMSGCGEAGMHHDWRAPLPGAFESLHIDALHPPSGVRGLTQAQVQRSFLGRSAASPTAFEHFLAGGGYAAFRGAVVARIDVVELREVDLDAGSFRASFFFSARYHDAGTAAVSAQAATASSRALTLRVRFLNALAPSRAVHNWESNAIPRPMFDGVRPEATRRGLREREGWVHDELFRLSTSGATDFPFDMQECSVLIALDPMIIGGDVDGAAGEAGGAFGRAAHDGAGHDGYSNHPELAPPRRFWLPLEGELRLPSQMGEWQLLTPRLEVYGNTDVDGEDEESVPVPVPVLALRLPLKRRAGVHVYGMIGLVLLTTLTFALFFWYGSRSPGDRQRGADATNESGSGPSPSSAVDSVSPSTQQLRGVNRAEPPASSRHLDRTALLLPLLPSVVTLGVGVGIYARPRFGGFTLFDRLATRSVSFVLGLCVLSVAYDSLQLPPSSDRWCGGGLLLWWAQYLVRLVWSVSGRHNAISHLYGEAFATRQRAPVAMVKAPRHTSGVHQLDNPSLAFWLGGGARRWGQPLL